MLPACVLYNLNVAAYNETTHTRLPIIYQLIVVVLQITSWIPFFILGGQSAKKSDRFSSAVNRNKKIMDPFFWFMTLRYFCIWFPTFRYQYVVPKPHEPLLRCADLLFFFGIGST